jgi:hypothetical protein
MQMKNVGAAEAQRKKDEKINENLKIPGSLPSPDNLFLKKMHKQQRQTSVTRF